MSLEIIPAEFEPYFQILILALLTFIFFKGTFYRDYRLSVPMLFIIIAIFYFGDSTTLLKKNIFVILLGTVPIIYSYHFFRKRPKNLADVLKLILVTYTIAVVIILTTLAWSRHPMFIGWTDVIISTMVFLITGLIIFDRRSTKKEENTLDDMNE